MVSLAALLCSGALFVAPQADRSPASSVLKLTVSPTEHRFAKGRPIELLVLLENTDAVHSWTLIPTLVAGSEDSDLYPEPYFTVRLIGPDGRPLQAIPVGVQARRVPPSTCEFATLGPSAVLGLRLSLSEPPFAFSFAESG